MTDSLRMHRHDPALTELIFNYMRDRLALAEVPLDKPGDASEIRAALVGMITPDGHPADAVLAKYDEILSRSVISADSPRFFAFIPAAPTKAALLFDMVVSCASLQGISWLEAAGAVAAENQVLRWLSDLAGLPASAGGTFVSGGSAANLSALTVARDFGRKRITGELHGPRVPVRIAVSEQAHSSIGNSLSILDVEPFVIKTDGPRLTGADLQRALAQVKPGELPVVGVVATAGTTNAGIVDDLFGIGEIARSQNMWFHIDAAYGGAGLLAPSLSGVYAGIELADSITMDPHKWWFAPFDVAAIIYREPALAKAVHTQDASYLDVLHTDEHSWNPTDYAYHLTRRARGLPFWFSLAVNGTDAYRDAVEAALSLTQQTAAAIKADPNLELVLEPTLSAVLFRRHGWTAQDYAELQNQLIDEQTAFITPTSWQGETVGRFAFIHPGTTFAMVEHVLQLASANAHLGDT